MRELGAAAHQSVLDHAAKIVNGVNLNTRQPHGVRIDIPRHREIQQQQRCGPSVPATQGELQLISMQDWLRRGG